jgi:hypothetical protein
MSKHTPGLWHLSVNKSWKTNPFSIVVRKDGVHRTTIANLPARKTIGPEEREATARLLTAAPDLLEALRSITDAADEKRVTAKHYEIARAAIAKATGETK